ncbi:MAG: conjugal transfer protein TraC [Rhodobacteraceae bacterium]|nr:MAG: conjugal transfer protein TraC [Paracoccaceae bacterium]
MRKVRDYDAELKALSDKARALKAKKVQQLGELVTSTGADALDLDVLAGVLIAAVETASAEEKEGWRLRGLAFFQGRGRKAGRRTGGDGEGGKQTRASEEQA